MPCRADENVHHGRLEIDAQVGIWDYNYWCNNPWSDPPETCDVYDGQKAGRFDNAEPVLSRGGRSDVEG